MPLALDSDPSTRLAPRRPGRWIAIGLASLLLHLTLLDMLPRWTLDPVDDETSDEPIHVKLMPAIDPTAPPPSLPAPRRVEPQPHPQPRPRTPPPSRRASVPTFVPDSDEPVPQVQLGPAPDSGPVVGATSPPVASPTPATAASDAPPAAAPVPAPAPPAPTVAPQSAHLSYQVRYVDTKNFNSVHYYGVGSIDWSVDGGRYRSDLVAAVDFLLFKVNVLASHSEGSIVQAGLAPDRYTESPRKRATVATNFNRDVRQSISFSASPATVPLAAGAQDRLSVLFQIGALLLADPRQSTVGGRIEIPVAGVRGEVDPWVFETLGMESTDAAGSTLETTHLRYVPRLASNDRTIDVWIARDGYPARVLYTEPNGNTTEMTLDAISALH